MQLLNARPQLPHLVLRALALFALTVPPWLAFHAGQRQGAQRGDRDFRARARENQREIARALVAEQTETKVLRQERDLLQQAVRGARDPGQLGRLRREVAQRRELLRPYDALLRDESLGLDQVAGRMAQLALGEHAGVEVSASRGRSRYRIVLRFDPQSSVELPDFALLAGALEGLPDQVDVSWFEALFLERAGAESFGARLSRGIPSEAWRSLLELYQEPHRRFQSSERRLRGGSRTTGQLEVFARAEHEIEIEVWGREGAKGVLRPKDYSFSQSLPLGTYTLRARPSEGLPWIGLVFVSSGGTTVHLR